MRLRAACEALSASVSSSGWRVFSASVSFSRWRCRAPSFRVTSRWRVSSRRVNSRTVLRNRSSKPRVWLTPLGSLTLAPNLRHQFIQLFHDLQGFVDARLQLHQILALELIGL